MNAQHQNPPSARRRGLSLVEAMISLAITALLLSGVAMAYDASTSAIEMNEQF